MEQSKKKTLIISILGVFIVIVALLGVTYAFFNYTRTGPANTVGTGRIYFDHTQGNTINMENAFPISSTAAQTDTTNAKTVQIIVTGDTDYSGGEEYLLTATDVNMETTTGKAVPISLEVSVTGRNSKTLGTAETGDYYANRDSYTTSKYKVEYDGELAEDSHLLVGWIAPNATSGTIEGVDGIINIKAYFNEDDILITDTLENGPIEEVGYDNGTQNNGKTVLTTSEWNSLKGNNALSFKIKAESREGKWVMPIISTCPNCVYTRTPTSSNPWYIVNNVRNQTPTVVNDSSTYYLNYQELMATSGKNYFLGMKLNENNEIEKAYSCGIKGENPNQGVAFCIEFGITDYPLYPGANTELLQNLWNGGCSWTNGMFSCDGIVSVYWRSSPSGQVGVAESGPPCEVNSGAMICYG